MWLIEGLGLGWEERGCCGRWPGGSRTYWRCRVRVWTLRACIWWWGLHCWSGCGDWGGHGWFVHGGERVRRYWGRFRGIAVLRQFGLNLRWFQRLRDLRRPPVLIVPSESKGAESTPNHCQLCQGKKQLNNAHPAEHKSDRNSTIWTSTTSSHAFSVQPRLRYLQMIRWFVRLNRLRSNRLGTIAYSHIRSAWVGEVFPHTRRSKHTAKHVIQCQARPWKWLISKLTPLLTSHFYSCIIRREAAFRPFDPPSSP